MWLDLNTISKLASIVSAFSLASGSAATWIIYNTIQKRSLHTEWLTSFRVIYQEFWKEEHNSIVRRWIASDAEYTEIQEILIERNNGVGQNNLDSSKNAKLDKLDGFLALLSRVTTFEKNRMTPEQRELWSAIYERYWITKMYTRPELKAYVENQWSSLYKDTYRNSLFDANASAPVPWYLKSPR